VLFVHEVGKCNVVMSVAECLGNVGRYVALKESGHPVHGVTHRLTVTVS